MLDNHQQLFKHVVSFIPLERIFKYKRALIKRFLTNPLSLKVSMDQFFAIRFHKKTVVHICCAF